MILNDRDFMHRIVFTFAFITTVVLAVKCTSTSNKQVNHNIPNNSKTDKYAELQYIEDFFDFGSIVQGEVVKHTFYFRNIGTDNLIVKDMIPDCGCTMPKIDKTLIKPGEEGSLEVVFDSKGWQGSQYKSVTLRTNALIREKSVTIKANVVPQN